MATDRREVLEAAADAMIMAIVAIEAAGEAMLLAKSKKEQMAAETSMVLAKRKKKIAKERLKELGVIEEDDEDDDDYRTTADMNITHMTYHDIRYSDDYDDVSVDSDDEDNGYSLGLVSYCVSDLLDGDDEDDVETAIRKADEAERVAKEAKLALQAAKAACRVANENAQLAKRKAERAAAKKVPVAGAGGGKQSETGGSGAMVTYTGRFKFNVQYETGRYGGTVETYIVCDKENDEMINCNDSESLFRPIHNKLQKWFIKHNCTDVSCKVNTRLIGGGPYIDYTLTRVNDGNGSTMQHFSLDDIRVHEPMDAYIEYIGTTHGYLSGETPSRA